MAENPGGYPQVLRTYGDHIRKRRLDLGLTRQKIARLIHVGDGVVGRWEKGMVENPPPVHWTKIIGFLGYDPRPELQEEAGRK